MALVKANSGFRIYTAEEYRAKKEKLLSEYDSAKLMRVGDDLLCKRCRQSVLCDLPGRNFIVRCNCRCEDAAWEKKKRDEARRASAERYAEAADRLEALGKAYETADFCTLSFPDANDDYVAAAERCERFCNNFGAVQRRGLGVWLWGAEGVGKTHFGACMFHRLRKDGHACVFTTAARILDAVWASYKSKTDTVWQVKSILSQAEVLFIDRFDEAIGGKTESAIRTLAETVRERSENLRPTVILSRLSMADFLARSGMDGGVMDSLAGRMASIRLVGRNRFCDKPEKAGF